MQHDRTDVPDTGGNGLVRPDRLPSSPTRREVLAAVTATGAAGTVGGGAQALVSDTESAPDNQIAAGGLDLELCWEPDGQGEDCTPESATTLTVDLGNLTVGRTESGSIRASLSTEATSNPAWLWLRSGCPPSACGLYGAVELTIWYDAGCDGGRDGEPPVVVQGTPIENLPLYEALELLAAGTLLDVGGTSAPLAPDADLCLGLEWTLTEAVCEGESGSFDLTFVGRQARHNPEPVNPWTAVDCAYETDCPEDCAPASFVAFCKDTGEIDMDVITDLSWTEETVTWVADEDLDSAVLFYGPPTFETFDPDDGFPAGEPHTIRRGEGVEKAEEYDQTQSDPCPDVASEGCGVKFEFPEDPGKTGTWECVCGPPGSERSCGGGA